MSWDYNFSKSEHRASSHNSTDNERPHLMTWFSPPTVIECKKPDLADQGSFQEETEFTPLNGAAHVRYSQLEHPIISSTTGRENSMSVPSRIRRVAGRGVEATQSDPESDTGPSRPVTPRGDYLMSSRASISLAANLDDCLPPNVDAGTPLNEANHRTAPFLTLWPLAVLIFYSEFSQTSQDILIRFVSAVLTRRTHVTVVAHPFSKTLKL
jgi:hypothetical protein